MGSCTLIGMFFNYYIERFDETDENGETIITFKASAQWGNTMNVLYSDTLTGIICKIMEECYDCFYYKKEILQFIGKLQKGAK